MTTPVAQDLVGAGVPPSFRCQRRVHGERNDPACAADSGELLPTGRYEVFAVVVVIQDYGTNLVAVGGPWPLEVT